MKFMLNNKNVEFDRSTMTVKELLEEKKFSFKIIVVRINNKIIYEKDYDTTYINEGDNVMVIHIFHGG